MAGKGIIRIYYKDSSYKSFYLHEDITAREVADLFAEDFLHVEKRVVAHFCIHVIIDGKDIRQLKPEDRPLRVQRDLFSLKISWNTDKNYFLFCLSDEAKLRMTQRLGSPTNMQGTSTVNKETESEAAQPRPLSRKLSFRRPKLTMFNTKRRSTEIQEKPAALTRSESEVFAAKKAAINSPTTVDRRSTVGSADDPNITISRQEISNNLKKLVMEEKKKLQTTEQPQPQAQAQPQPPTQRSPQLKRSESAIIGLRAPTSPEQQRVTAEDNKKTTNSVETKPAVVNVQQKTEPQPQPPKQGAPKKIMEEAKKPAAQPSPKNDPRMSTMVGPSPNTVRRENDEIANMFDSIFDWCPPTGSSSTAPSSAAAASASATQAAETPAAAAVNDDEEFNNTFDDILNVLHKLGTV